ncbi:MAG TPA: DNA translocase FtsK [Longimicrobiales bacterium]|nr:DNA translocase FtsK [Longimicrobiales bacterium]
MLSRNQRRQLLGVTLLALAFFQVLAMVPVAALGAGALAVFPTGNIMGVLGGLATRGGFALLGVGYLLVPLLLVLGAGTALERLPGERAVRGAALLTGIMVLVPTGLAPWSADSGLGAITLLPEAVPGWLGRTLALPLVALLGVIGAMLVLLVLVVMLLIVALGWRPLRGRAEAAGGAAGVVEHVEEPEPAGDVPEPALVAAEAGPATARAEKPRRGRERLAEVVLADTGNPHAADLPPLPLLSEPPTRGNTLSEGELDRLGRVLIETLRTFKVEGEIAGRTTGPVVTQFEVVPAPGIKVNRIAALDADLALALRAPSIRIVAPIPGKGAVGVDVPNPEPEIVYLRRILETAAFGRARGVLPLGLGKDLTGRPYVADLAKMPHLLIAGATGSGKSICINTLITSLVYKHSPRTLRLLMVDPKMVELSMYADLPHLRHPVVTDPHDAATVLKWAVYEMERRYSLLSTNNVRSLAEFNRRVEEGHELKRAFPSGGEFDLDRWRYQDGVLPYIVVVVDELADLMMTVQAEIEKPLAQLAQKARAIGIHLIVATQRPSVNVITGLIKANFPCRIAFRVSSKVDSRTILDQNGADALLGNGDMLFMPPGHSDPVRIQGAYLSTEDTEALMRWYRERGATRAEAEEDILEVVRSQEASDALDDGMGGAPEERDALFRQAAEVCLQHNQGSTSLLQRRLRIGYGRAARIIDQLHTAGVLGPPDGSKPREVLVGMESLEHICGDS